MKMKILSAGEECNGIELKQNIKRSRRQEEVTRTDNVKSIQFISIKCANEEESNEKKTRE